MHICQALNLILLPYGTCQMIKIAGVAISNFSSKFLLFFSPTINFLVKKDLHLEQGLFLPSQILVSDETSCNSLQFSLSSSKLVSFNFYDNYVPDMKYFVNQGQFSHLAASFEFWPSPRPSRFQVTSLSTNGSEHFFASPLCIKSGGLSGYYTPNSLVKYQQTCHSTSYL